MKLLPKYKYWLLAVVVLATLAYWMVYGGELFTMKKIVEQLPNPVIMNTTMVEDKDGKRSWEITADRVEIDAAKDLNMLTGVKGKIYRADGTHIDVRSDSGTYNTKSREAQLVGKVFAVYSGDGTLKCDKIVWTPAKNSIVATGKVELKTPRFFASGDKMETDRDVIKMKITGNGFVRREVQQ